MQNNENLNEFELAMISGGGEATFSEEQLDSHEKRKELAETLGESVETIDGCIKDTGKVEVKKPTHKPVIKDIIKNLFKPHDVLVY
mgnify:FL=1